MATPAPAAGGENPYGLIAALQQGGTIAWTVFIILVVMSAASWYILFVKLFEQQKIMNQGRKARTSFWQAANPREGAAKLEQNSAYRQIVDDGLIAMEQHNKLTDPIDQHDWMQNSLARSQGAIASRLSTGLALLATVGSTAPFIGLFGTVIGIYRALIKIGAAGQASIDAVAGPVGEALIMTAHAGRNPEDGRNAIVAAADLALRLARARGPRLSVNPARIEGGSPNNVVPDRAVLRVNMRPATVEDQQRGQAQLDAAVAMVTAEHDVKVHVHGGFGRPPKPLDAEAEKLFGLVRRCGADLGQEIGWKATGGVCDGNNIAACGVPVVDTMGVRGGAIHSPDEYLIVESLLERAQLSALTILRLAAGGGL